MSKEREVLNLTDSSIIPEDESLQAYEARMLQIAERGLTIDASMVKLPNDLTGQWVHNDPTSIAEARMKGFELDKTHAPKSDRLHDRGDGLAHLGDTVFMTISKAKAEILTRIEARRMAIKHNRKETGENAFYKNQLQTLGNKYIPAVDRSQSEIISGNELQGRLGETKG